MDNACMPARAHFPKFEIKGIEVAAVDLATAGDFIGQHAASAHGEYVTVTGARGIVSLSTTNGYGRRISGL